MRIKLAIVDPDQDYLNRIVSIFNTKYSEKFEIYSFTDISMALDTLDRIRIDVLLSSDSMDIDVSKLPEKCGFAYFVEAGEIESLNGRRAISKYQKIDMIYKEILGIYSENAAGFSGVKIGEDGCKVLCFSSPCGGTGTSSLAAASARYFARNGFRTLFLSFENFGSSDVFFSAPGQHDMSDVIFALKSKKANVAMKMESCVKQDASGVFFYSQSKLALDMIEMTGEDFCQMLSVLRLTGSYDYIIFDADFSFDQDMLTLYKQAQTCVWVSDGSETANTKILRAYASLSLAEQDAEDTVTSRLSLIYNKFSNKSSHTIEDAALKVLGGIPRYEHASADQVVSQIAAMELFAAI